MNRIDTLFQALKKAQKKAFIAYITAGDPSLKVTEQLVLSLEKNGADLVELGIPFSDPLADGKENQASAIRALKQKTTIKKILHTVKHIRKKSSLPLIFFTYVNPVLQYGLERFMRDSYKAGIDGTLILDLPPEESKTYTRSGKKYNLKTIYLVTPNTPLKRIQKIAALSSGFIYYVSRTGVTGMRKTVEKNIALHVGNIKRFSRLPVVVGFGISTPKQAQAIAILSDGVVVGSAIVAKIKEHIGSKRPADSVGNFARRLITGVKKI